MKKKLQISAILLLVAFCFYSVSLSINRDSQNDKGVSPNIPHVVAYKEPMMKAPVESLVSLDGRSISIGKSGKPAILNFWASWCPPCRSETAVLKKFSKKIDSDLHLYGINVTKEEKLQDVVDFVRKEGIDYTILLDAEGKAEMDYGIATLPVTLVINSSGRIISRHTGPVTEKILDEMLKQLHSSN